MNDRIREMLARWKSWIKETDEIVQMHTDEVVRIDDDIASTMKAAADRLRKQVAAVEKKHDA